MKKNTPALFTPIGPVSCQRTGSFSHPRSFLLQNQIQIQKQLNYSNTTHMKRFLLSLVAIAALSLSSFGQSPEGFKYQAVVRDAGNLILSSQAVGMQLTIQQGNIGGTAVYTETFAPTTNAYGLVNLEIGSGTSTDDFTTLDWANGPYFMETAVDVTGGTSYSIMGTSQLMSVPYALYAKTSGNGAGPAGADGAQGIQGETGAAGTNGTQPIYTVNTLYPELGGYVIAVRDGGKHGLVVAMQDQGISNWYLANDLLSHANNHDVNGAKFMDWRLPTRRELNLMYIVYTDGVNGAVLNANYYWSSTQNDYNFAWPQNFFFGGQGTNNKNIPRYVRAVRAF
jgi:hypothetical protein